MKFLLINQYYAPDVAPTGQVLADVARTLAARGHQVEVLASRAAYDGGAPHPPREERDGVVVHRLAGPRLGPGLLARVSQQAVFLAALTGALARRRADLVLCLTTPPYVGLFARAMANLRGARHAHWVMDVYPDALAVFGWLSPTGLPFRALSWLARLQMQGAALVLSLGPVQRERVAPYAGGAAVPWVPLWSAAGGEADAEATGAERAARGWSPEDVVLMYSGNLGRGHAVDEFLEAARRLGAAGPRWAFCGGGERTREVAAFMARHPQARVQSFAYVPSERLARTLAAGDVHLVGVREAWQGVIVPSKVQAAFSAGRPVLMVGGRDNEAARWIEESGGGWRAEEGDMDGLLAAIEQALDAGERGRRAQAARAYAREHFDAARNCARIAEMLESCVSGRAGS
jgi:colanic acid biosynthesis glycosyl transferase WcaI